MFTLRQWCAVLGYWLVACAGFLSPEQGLALYTPIPHGAALADTCPQDGVTPCRILIAGDSIALGNEVVNGMAVPTGGIRPRIDALILAAGKRPVQWVGRFADAWGATSAAAGYWVADTTEPGFQPFPGVQDFFPADIQTFMPHVVLLYVGINNCKFVDWFGLTGVQAATEYVSLVNSIHATPWTDPISGAHVTPLVIVTKIAPLSPYLGDRNTGAIDYLNNEADIFNRTLEQMYGEDRYFSLWNVLLYDAEKDWYACSTSIVNGLSTCHHTNLPSDPCICWDPGNYSDWVHPSDAGYQTMAQGYYNLLAPLLQ